MKPFGLPETTWLSYGREVDSPMPEQDCYSQAAGRHLHSSEVLLAASDWDNALYLAGYAVECTLKTLMQIHLGYVEARSFEHRIRDLEGAGLQRVRDLHPRIGLRLPTSSTVGTIVSDQHPWRRYLRNGVWSSEDVRQAVQRARDIYSEVVLKLVLDGVIDRRDV